MDQKQQAVTFKAAHFGYSAYLVQKPADGFILLFVVTSFMIRMTIFILIEEFRVYF